MTDVSEEKISASRTQKMPAMIAAHPYSENGPAFQTGTPASV